jgi:hypothetical protein
LIEPQLGATTFEEFLRMHTELRDSHLSASLKADIIKHEHWEGMMRLRSSHGIEFKFFELCSFSTILFV